MKSSSLKKKIMVLVQLVKSLINLCLNSLDEKTDVYYGLYLYDPEAGFSKLKKYATVARERS